MGTGLLSRLGSTVILKGWAFHEKLSIPGLQSSDLGRTWGGNNTHAGPHKARGMCDHHLQALGV